MRAKAALAERLRWLREQGEMMLVTTRSVKASVEWLKTPLGQAAVQAERKAMKVNSRYKCGALTILYVVGMYITHMYTLQEEAKLTKKAVSMRVLSKADQETEQLRETFELFDIDGMERVIPDAKQVSLMSSRSLAPERHRKWRHRQERVQEPHEGEKSSC